MSRLLIVLGAGATAGSGFKMPTKGNQFDTPPTDINFWTAGNKSRDWEERPALKYILDSLYLNATNFGLEQIWNIINVHKKYTYRDLVRYSEAERDKLKNLSWNIGWFVHRKYNVENATAAEAELDLIRLVTRVYGRGLIVGYKDNPGKPAKTGYRNFLEPIKGNGWDVSFVSFNYDCSLEWALNKELKRNFYYPNFEVLPMGDLSLPIFKLHGSLNWQHGYDGYVRLKTAPLVQL